jgi:hypothetical protein
MTPVRDAAGRRSRSGRRLVAFLALAALGLLGQPLAGPTDPARAATATHSAGPDGRSTYVIAMMDGRQNALAVRLAVYRFSRDGTVTETYWAWRQDRLSGKGNVRWSKPFSGYTTTGCRHACPIRTPIGFQKGARPNTYTGHWSMASDQVLAIRWTATAPVERWQLDDSRPGVVGARLLSGGSGWGMGSNASATRGVPLSTVYQDAGWITGPFAENAYASPTRHASIGFSTADYTLCSTGQCLQSRTVTDSDKRSWYSSYFGGDPAVDGRKTYWNNQTGVVQQLENPGSVCISASGGGHTNALLQVLDDDGRFVGFVGVEASLNQRKYGQDVVAAYAMVEPDLLPAIGAQ